jgi:DNA polymerase-3 subunit alpha
LDFELLTISNSGYPGYFLIVQDFIAKAREMDVSVGPGRGSAAGSAVAYCLKLLILILSNTICFFERFLNRIVYPCPILILTLMMKVVVVLWIMLLKYGANQVAQIITYGKMATKSAFEIPLVYWIYLF